MAVMLAIFPRAELLLTYQLLGSGRCSYCGGGAAVDESCCGRSAYMMDSKLFGLGCARQYTQLR